MYKVVNVSPRLTEDERKNYIKCVTPLLIHALGEKCLVEADKNRPVYDIKEKSISDEILEDSLAMKAARAFIDNNPNYYIW